jgi:molecular chaperone DnaK
VPQIEVTFDIDANGIVNVSAKDRGTGKEQKITITASSGLSKDEVDRMMREAEAHADEDKRNREAVETRNKADQAVYGAERLLAEAGAKLSAADTAAVQEAIDGLKAALERQDADAIARGLEALTQAQYKIADVLYRQSGPQGSPETSAGPSADAPREGTSGQAGSDVIDAEVVDDDKK